MKLVIIESPHAGDIEKNVAYARRCMKDCLDKGEAPYASHLLYTQVLDDTIQDERDLGIEAGLCWGKMASKTVIYADLGVSPGMRLGIKRAMREKREVEFRKIGVSDD